LLLGAYWKERRITAGQFIRLCFDFLAALRDFSTAFDKRCVALGEFPNVFPADVPKDYDSFEELMLNAIPNPKHIYNNPDSAIRHLTLNSTIPVGFRTSFSDPAKQRSFDFHSCRRLRPLCGNKLCVNTDSPGISCVLGCRTSERTDEIGRFYMAAEVWYSHLQ
jgi:hypothetical protein